MRLKGTGLDTRTKIGTVAEAAEAARLARAAGRPVKLVSGHFDPLLAAHAHRLAGIADPPAVLFAAITEPERPILAARARAVLVAALAAVDRVIVCGTASADEAVAAIAPDEVYRDEAGDERRTREFVQHVESRHG